MFIFLGFIPKNFLEKQTHKETQKIQLKKETQNPELDQDNLVTAEPRT